MVIPVKTDTRDYDIILESGALAKDGSLLNLNRKVLVVTDDGVPAGYSETVEKACKEAVKIVIPQGEGSKNMDSFKALLSAMLGADFTRADCVVAVGGGVVGDLSAFAAACYMRGIEFYNIPTTLLSQVDSSVGGKAAVDFEGVKNIVGAFWQPSRVIIDPDTLKTLDERQINAGLCEAVKMAATCDGELFEFIEKSVNLADDLPEIIRRALLIKRDVVEKDTREQGLRKVLNFGHTVGHAVESAEGGRLLHGECVGVGMLVMSEGEARERIEKVLEKYNLPTRVNQTADELMPYIVHDKKGSSGGVTAVRVSEIGKFEFVKMTNGEIKELLVKNI